MELLDALEEKKLTYVGTLQKDKNKFLKSFFQKKQNP